MTTEKVEKKVKRRIEVDWAKIESLEAELACVQQLLKQ